MKILARIPTMNAGQLATLRANARRVLASGIGARGDEAEAVLDAIAAEEARRAAEEGARREAARTAAGGERAGLLFDRVIAAFTALPAGDGDRAILSAIAGRPGASGGRIARTLGRRDVGYVNLAVGTICSAREVWLGPAPLSKMRNGEKLYSALLIDFSLHREPDGSRWYGWALKPGAEAALRHLGVVTTPPPA